MGYVWQRWMPEAFRAAGLEVIEIDGWENRGRPASSGGYDPRRGITNHHTGATSSPADPHPTLKTLIAGRSDLPGPLAPWSVDHLGRVLIIAAGRCNHAGRIGKRVPFAVLGADGNALLMGDEIDTNGTQPLSEAQRHAVAVTNRVYCDRMGLPVDPHVHRHEDISATGKWDLGSLTTNQLRRDAAALDLSEEDDMQLSDPINPKDPDSPRIGQLFRRLNRFLTNSAARQKAALAEIRELEEALDNAMPTPELRRRLRRIEAEVAALRDDVDEQPTDG